MSNDTFNQNSEAARAEAERMMRVNAEIERDQAARVAVDQSLNRSLAENVAVAEAERRDAAESEKK